MTMQQKYWRIMIQTKFEYLYFNLFYEQSVKANRLLGIFLAVASCGSIAGWALWSQFAVVWAVIIALSQVINAINPFIPYADRVTELFELKVAILGLFRQLELEWYNVAEGVFTSDELNERIQKAKSDADTIKSNYLINDYLSMNKKIERLANEMTDDYFVKNY